jgi:hypothetical protein
MAMRAARRSFRIVLGKPGPTLSLRDESPAGETVSGMPAGERARKRRAAQAAYLRGASRTPLARGHHDNASAGVPLSFSCWKRVDKWRFVDETASIVRSELLRGFVVTGKTRAQKKRAARTDNLMLRCSALWRRASKDDCSGARPASFEAPPDQVGGSTSG